MNYKKACENLELENEEITLEILKKHYKMKALKYHPDKNSSPDAATKFHEISESYEFILRTLDDAHDYHTTDDCMFPDENSYQNVLFSFIRNIMKNDLQQGLLSLIIQKISTTCENKALDTLSKIDKSVLIKIHELIKKYRESFHFSDDFFQKFDEIVKNVIQEDECIILNPVLDDLFDNNLYKLRIKTHTYIVPLWHHELVYDNSGNDIYIKCYPLLPDNVMIDECNDIIVKIVLNINDIWNQETIEISLGKKYFSFPVSKLCLKQNQVITLKKQGITRINTKDIYDILNKGDVIINVDLLLTPA